MVRSYMILALKKNLPLLRCCCSSKFSSLGSPKLNPLPKFQFDVKDYLIGSCGFSPKKAATASKHLKFASASEPDSVKHFLKHKAGFTDSQVDSIILRDFYILDANVEKTVEPNLEALSKLSHLSDTQRRELVISHPSILVKPQAVSLFEFWKDFQNDDTGKLLLDVKKSLKLLRFDIDEGGTFAQKVALLKEYGLSHADIVTIAVKFGGLFSRTTVSIEGLLKEIEEFGLPRGCPMFITAFSLLCTRPPNHLKSRMEFFKGYGLGEDEIVVAFFKVPNILCMSEENLREKMEFWVDRAGCDASYIAFRPSLLMLSLENRLIPRYHVMLILKFTGLLTDIPSLFYIFKTLSNDMFFTNYIHPYIKEEPEIAQFAPGQAIL